ncbi:MAG: glycosyltransferase family 2 protein [Anaerolineae bacterium]
MNLEIIIVSWNVKQLLADCLESVFTCPPETPFRVVVVDNASTDGSAEMVRTRFPQVQLIESEENLGFAGGNNLALAQSEAELALLLNPDTAVRPGAIQALVDFLAQRPEAGAAGSRLLNPDGTLQHPSCHPAPTLARELWRLFHLDRIRPYGAYHMASWSLTEPRPVDVIQGASLLLRRSVLDRIGLLDESYFMYSEEVDLCLRIQRAGWELFWVPASQVVHYGGQSTRQVAAAMFQQLYRAKLMYFRKHYGKLTGVMYKLVLTAASLARLLLTPLAFLQRPSVRQRNLSLGKQYWLLLRALPQM